MKATPRPPPAPASPPASSPRFDAARLREDFPILKRVVNGKPLVYLDNAATTQKPEAVLRAIDRFYRETNSNVHRGVHRLSEEATAAYEGAREKVRAFLNAKDVREVVFTRGTTEAVNLVAHAYGRGHLKPGDEVLITGMEHHSNIVPWQLLCQATGAKLEVAPFTDEGELIVAEFEKRLTPRTKIAALTHVSNSLGTVNPVKRLVALARKRKVPVLVDGAQAVAHLPVDVQDLGCDFYAFSGHKVYGPTGIGVLYGRAELLEAMPPFLGGGDMIRTVTFETSTWNDLPYKFEAGTPPVAEAIGLGAALDYLRGVGVEAAGAWEEELLRLATKAVGEVPGARLIGTAPKKAAVLSFVLEGVHPHDVGTVLDQEGIAIRTGHHCAQPVMQRFGVPATARASFAFYNLASEVDALARGLAKVREIFR